MIYRASSAPRLSLIADEEIPTSPPIDSSIEEWTEKRRAFFRGQAKEISDALWRSLPGGTIEALLVEMLDRRRLILVGRL